MAYRIKSDVKAMWDRAIYFIAHNDDPGASDALDFETVRGYISTICVAETFNVHAEKVARAVLKERRRLEKLIPKE